MWDGRKQRGLGTSGFWYARLGLCEYLPELEDTWRKTRLVGEEPTSFFLSRVGSTYDNHEWCQVENLLGIFGFQRKLFPLHPGVSSFTPAVPSGIRGKYLICKEPNQQLQNWNEEEMEGEDTEAGQHQLYQEDHVFCCRHSWTPLAPALPKLWLFTFYLNSAFELWCWRRLLRVPWTARRSNQSILKEINSYS